MEPIREIEDFQESELFGDFSEGGAESGSEEPEYVEEKVQALRSNERGDEPEETSAKSSLTITALDGGVELPHDAAEGSGDVLTELHRSTAPPLQNHVRMGSSVPVSIPHMNRWKKADAAPDSPTTQYAPATFVPPHQLSQVNQYMFSLTGESPSVAIKRDRLRARNAILRSTGFLEPGIDMASTFGLQERNRLTVATGGLTQALQQQGAAVPAAVESS